MYCISQRAEHIWEGVSSATTRSRPIINTRDEPHADAERYRRLHVIVGDSNMSEYATFLKVGTTSILLRMLEDPAVVLRDMTLENPIRAIREISHDVSCKRRVRLANGREASALDIQGEYLTRAKRYAETNGLSPLEEEALGMWEHCLAAIEKDPWTLDRECDWVIKHSLIDRYRQRHNVPLTHPKVALMDLQYHDVSRDRGLFYRLQGKGLVDRMCTDDEIDLAVDEPPQTTRAACGVNSSGGQRNAAVTSRWTGYTSSSTTRPSGPCCARTRSRPATSGWRSSSPRCRRPRGRLLPAHPRAGGRPQETGL